MRSFKMRCFKRFLMKRCHFYIYILILICFIILAKYLNLSGNFSKPLGGSHQVVIPKPSTSPNASSCYCEDGSLLHQYVPTDQLDDILKHRIKEYKEHQHRMMTNVNILVAPANSPLQYPISGFTVSPLQKSVIPGLALHTEKRKLYKVTLRVDRGVLAVKDARDEEQVNGQDKSELTIISTSLTQLNDLLSRVTYTSTIYHIRTSDLVHFSFENYTATFPIIIRRHTVPVLYYPGNDINSLVTITTKTFLRYKQLHVLLHSIRIFYPTIKIIIADDSLKPENVSADNIEQYIMPPAQGWFAGRNLAVSQVTTKYFLWVDDDFEFLNETRIERFVEIMEAVPDLDVLGGTVSGSQFYYTLEYEEGDEGGCLKRIKEGHHNPLPGYDGCFFVDVVVNFFLARTDAVRRVGFDPILKRVAHTEFFIDGLGQLLVAFCKDPSVGHQAHEALNEYDSYRNQDGDEEKRKLAHHFFKNYLKCIKY